MVMMNADNFPTRATILVVDDTTDNLVLMSELLKDLYKVKVANSGEKALKYIQNNPHPDLILLAF
jgi:putative two-component system response regulator